MLAGATPASAQIVVHESGVKAGLIVSTVTRADASDTGRSARAGFSGGVFAARHIQPSLLAQVEALVSTKGYERPGERLRATYLEVPALVKYRTALQQAGSVAIFVTGGPAIGVRLSATRNRDDVGSEDAGGAFRAFDLGLHVGAGIERDGIILEVRYSRSLTDIRADRMTGPAERHRADRHGLAVAFLHLRPELRRRPSSCSRPTSAATCWSCTKDTDPDRGSRIWNISSG